MKKNNYIGKIIMVFFLIVLTTGCSNEYKINSKEKLGKKVVECLSNANYECVANLIDLDESVLFDVDYLKKYIEDNNLNIENNKKIEVMKDEENSKTVRIKIDNNKIFEIDTIKKEDGSYKVKLDNINFADGFTIDVPHGATLKINNIKIDSKKAKTINISKPLSFGGVSDKVSLSMDSYIFEKVIEQPYNVEIENEGCKTIKETLPSKYYEYDEEDSNKNFYINEKEYVAKMKPTDEKEKNIKEFVENYYKDIYNNINAKNNFSKLENYYLTPGPIDESNYENNIKNMDTSKSYSEEMSTDFNPKSYDYLYIYAYDDETIGVFVEYEYTYKYHFKYIDFMSSATDFNVDEVRTKSNNALIVLKEKGKLYKIVNDGSLKKT